MAEAHRTDPERWQAVVPLLYDWVTHHPALWPPLSCRWGGAGSGAGGRLGAAAGGGPKQAVYYAEQTDGGSGSSPNTLVVATAEVPRTRCTPADALLSVGRGPSFLRRTKTLVHPGEVNKIREVPAHPHLVLTHTDSPEVLLWNVDSQPNRGTTATSAAKPSVPDLVLEGHAADAEFALGVSASEPVLVASGGRDETVLVWCLADANTGALFGQGGHGAAEHNNPEGAGTSAEVAGPRLQPRVRLRGHTDTVEDVCFNPRSDWELCSVGDDNAIVLWDTRAGAAPVAKNTEAHTDDIHCVDWSVRDANLIVTGSKDGIVRVFDRRALAERASRSSSAPLATLKSHTDEISCVQWCPDSAMALASGGRDGVVCVWDVARRGAEPARDQSGPPELLMQHVGHFAEVADLHWNPCSPWTLLSAGIMTDNAGPGSNSLQAWRPLDILYRDEAETLREIDELCIGPSLVDGIPALK